MNDRGEADGGPADRMHYERLFLYDLHSDGDIDIVDIMRAAGHWGESC
jgi:hypothetical protein